MTQKDNFYRNMTNILLTLIAIFGIFSIMLLINVNIKLNDIAIEQAIHKEKYINLDSRLTKIENKVK